MDGDKQPLMQPPPPAYAPPPQNYSAYPPPSAPPPAYGYPPQQHTSHTVVVAQPAPVVYQRRYGSGDHFLVLSIVFSFICCFCGTWLALLCTIPAIFFAINAQEAESRGDNIEMERNHRIALYLNIGAIATYIVTWVLLIILISVRAVAIANSSYCYYNSYGYHYCYK